jgi:N-methylhydantoinase A
MSSQIERIAFDIGGTFTDVVVLWTDGRVGTAKILSLLDTVGEDIRRRFKLDETEVRGFIHGTTVAANALLEGKVARIGLITTNGFRDVLEMRSQRRPNIYDVNWDRSKPLAPRERRLEVRERVLADGAIETPLDLADAGVVVDRLAAENIDSIALCLVNSYVNPIHERALACQCLRRSSPRFANTRGPVRRQSMPA